MSTESDRTMTTWSAVALLVSLQIGSGVFATPGQVDGNMSSPGATLLTWIAVGLLSWTGALCFAQLGAALPSTGGMQEYLRYIYGDSVAFLMGWNWILAVKPASMAIQSTVLVETLVSSLFPQSSQLRSRWQLKLLAICAQLIVVLLNSKSTKTTAHLNTGYSILKLVAVIAFAFSAFGTMLTHFIHLDIPDMSDDWYSRSWFETRPSFSSGVIIEWSKLNWMARLRLHAQAVYAGLWAYSGWDNANFVAGEIKAASTALPTAINGAMILIICSFLMLNWSYYILLPWERISMDDAVAVNAACAVLGSLAAKGVAVFIAVSCAGSLNSQVFTTGHLTAAAATRQYLPGILGRRGLFPDQTDHGPPLPSDSEARPLITESLTTTGSTRDQACVGDVSEIGTTRDMSLTSNSTSPPIIAMLFNSGVTAVYILCGSLSALLIFAGIAEYLFFFLTTVGLIHLRRTDSKLAFPYQKSIFIAIVFTTVSLILLTSSVIYAPVQATVVILVLSGGQLVMRRRRAE